MNTNIVLIVLLLCTFIIVRFTSNKDESMPNSLFSTGIILVLSGVPQLDEWLFEIVAQQANIKISGNEGPYWLRSIIGIVLIILGILLSRKSVYILNMHGVFVQKDIDSPVYLKTLKLSKYKIKETVIDFVDIFKSKPVVDSERNEIICNTIEKSANKFSSLNADNKSACFTGMAPIPYTVLAGTFLGDSHIDRYFEYKSKEDNYYELKKHCIIKKWDKLKISFPEKAKTDAKEILLAISISHMINDNDLSQFNFDKVHISLDDPCDNIVKSKPQLDDYCETIYSKIENEIMEKYPHINTIHIVASVPSCVSIELGKRFAFRGNRLTDMIVYHYVSSANQKYIFGLYVTGDKKGTLITNGE